MSCSRTFCSASMTSEMCCAGIPTPILDGQMTPSLAKNHRRIWTVTRYALPMTVMRIGNFVSEAISWFAWNIPMVISERLPTVKSRKWLTSCELHETPPYPLLWVLVMNRGASCSCSLGISACFYRRLPGSAGRFGWGLAASRHTFVPLKHFLHLRISI